MKQDIDINMLHRWENGNEVHLEYKRGIEPGDHIHLHCQLLHT